MSDTRQQASSLADKENPAAVRLQQLTLGEALQEAVKRHGSRELLVFPDRRWSTAEFSLQVEKLARALLRLGVRKGDHVAVWLPNLPEACVIEFAVARLGAAMVAINTRYKTSEFEYVLRQSDATALFLTPSFLTADFVGMVHQVLPELSTCEPGKLACSAAPRLKRAIVLREPQPGMFAYEDVMKMGESDVGNEQIRFPKVLPDDTVLLQYTSGTTAFPKAVMLNHGQVLRNAYQMAERAGIGEGDRVLSAMPMFHVGGSVCALLGAVTRGYTLYMSPTFDARETLGVMEREAITTYIGLESMFIALRNHEDFARRSRASLAKGWTAGTSEILRMVAEEIGIRNICPLYGLSEGSPNVCIADWRDPYEKRIHTMGRPQPGTEVKIVDPATGATLPAGARGEICVRGYSVMKGYYNKPEETARALDEDGWLHTGDLGRMDEDGYLTWTGRLKDMLRVGGENVSALEIENFLCSHPAVQAALVVGVPEERLGEVPFAFVQLKRDAQLQAEALIAYCKQRIAGFKVPRFVRIVEGFEMTGSGKIQKYVMKERALAELKQASG